MGDNFDEMSNDQLRLKLLEFGLANMPVTTTTRKVLIKKLRNHISTNGKRRETISLTKYSSDEDSEPASSQNAARKKGSTLAKKELTNRRATIGVVATTKQPKPVSSSQPLPKVSQAPQPESAAASKRRSGRVTPVNDNVAAPASSQAAPKVPAILEDSDDDMIPLTQLTQRSRKSASPSLSRADMLTTSYIHQMAVPSKPSVPIVEEMEVDVPEMGKHLEGEEDVIVLDDDEDDDAMEMVSMPPPPQPKPSGGKASYSQTTAQTEVHRTFTAGTMTDQKDQEQKTFVEPTPPSYSSTDRTFPKPSFFASPSIRSSMSSTVRDETASKKIDSSESPYLSEFTKRLARLRAEAAEPSIGLARDSPTRRTMYEGSGSSTRSTYVPRDNYEPTSSRYRVGRQTIAPMGTGGRRTATLQSETDIRGSVRQSLLALDRKYSIRKIFYTIIIVLVVIFLFVFFFL